MGLFLFMLSLGVGQKSVKRDISTSLFTVFFFSLSLSVLKIFIYDRVRKDTSSNIR